MSRGVPTSALKGIVSFDFQFEGSEQIHDRLAILADACDDWRPIWQAIHGSAGRGAYTKSKVKVLDEGETFLAIERAQFRSEGARGGHPWDRYTNEPRYAAMKARVLGASGRVMPILRWVPAWQDAPGPKERLYPAMVDAKHPGHLFAAKPLEAEMGLQRSLGYARDLQMGGRMQRWDNVVPPARRIVDLTPGDVQGWRRGISRYIHYFLGDIRLARKTLSPKRPRARDARGRFLKGGG